MLYLILIYFAFFVLLTIVLRKLGDVYNQLDSIEKEKRLETCELEKQPCGSLISSCGYYLDANTVECVDEMIYNYCPKCGKKLKLTAQQGED